MTTAVLVVNYRSGDALGRCLESLAASDARALPLWIVDHGSDDGSLDSVHTWYPEARIERAAENRGFAAGVNRGVAVLREQGFERVLVLNPDTRVEPDFYAPLTEALEDPQVALAGPKLRSPGEPPTIWCAGGRATFGLNLSHMRGHRRRDVGQFDRIEDVEFLPGTVWLLRVGALAAVGGLDERFFCYVEDLELCVRLRERGFRLRYRPDSVVEHLGSHSSGGGYTALRKYLNARGGWIVLREHGSFVRWFRYVTGELLTAPLALVYGTLRLRPGAAWWKVRGLWDGFRRREFDGRLRRRLLGSEETTP